jgi:catechol 2,3-dioxygenase-like lactoylglutathione lyase family enzyme
MKRCFIMWNSKGLGIQFVFAGIDHIQLAAPEGCEAAARSFFTGLLGWKEVSKPEALQKRGGVWFQCGSHQVHIGVQQDFFPAGKAHPAFHVHNIQALSWNF